MMLLLAACGRFTGGDLDRNPDYIRARNAEAAGDFHVAATFYSKALREVPDGSKAHLEFGLLCDEKLGDPIAAIYHYRQFLELEPNSERRQVVDGYIERAKYSLAAKLPVTTAADPAELMRLQFENTNLRARLSELEHTTNIVVAPPVAPVAVITNTPPVTGSRTHVVQKGDTLQSLSLRYYGTRSAWEKIFMANRTILPTRDQLKVGQQLVIP